MSITYPVSSIQSINTPQGKAQRILQSGSQSLAQLAQGRINSYKLFWSDPVNIAAVWGTSAAGIFQDDADLVSFLGPKLIAAGAPSAIIAAATAGIPSTWSVAYNGDGSITVTAVAPAPTVAKE